MSIKWFECTKGHLFEHYTAPKNVGKVSYSLKELLESKPLRIKCKVKNCKSWAKSVILSRRKARMARRFAPSLMFVNQQGHVINPGRNNKEHLPKGYIEGLLKKGYKEIEITTFREYESFVKSQEIKLGIERDKFIHKEQQIYDEEIREGIDFLKRGGEMEIPDEKGGMKTIKVPRLEDMTPKGRAFAELAIQRAREHSIQADKPKVGIDAMENEGRFYRDVDTSGKRRWN